MGHKVELRTPGALTPQPVLYGWCPCSCQSEVAEFDGEMQQEAAAFSGRPLAAFKAREDIHGFRGFRAIAYPLAAGTT